LVSHNSYCNFDGFYNIFFLQTVLNNDTVLGMSSLRRLSIIEQTVAHLRERLRQKQWEGTMPGVRKLALELDISPNTADAALRQLEAEGQLATGGVGRRRSIIPGGGARRSLRIGILAFDRVAREKSHRTGAMIQSQHELLFVIQHDLEARGHEVFFCPKSQEELGHEAPRVATEVGKNPADAWIVVAGSRPVLEWFARQQAPSLALYGRTGGLTIARTGPDKVPALIEATRRLLALGHRRIMLINRAPRRKPEPGAIEVAFLAELNAHGIPTGAYNLPDWEETPVGFSAMLERVFHHTPPTALIIYEVAHYLAALQFLASHHLDVPGQVSLVCTDYHLSLAWFHPPVAHIYWDTRPIVRRIIRWVAAVEKGRPDRKTINYPAEFVPGGSIGPVRK
jgi:DNA-binding LacI/PurR family transcriptional regulator